MRILLLTVALCLAALAGASPPSAAPGFALKSGAFTPGQPIPARHTCDGQDLSPELHWSGAPENTRAFALLCDDPDAPSGTWVHWVVYDLPPAAVSLPEGSGRSVQLPAGSREGLNGWGKTGYRGPCPPPEYEPTTHRYFFKLYALDTLLGLPEGALREEVEAAIEGHVLATAELYGTYSRD